MVSYTNLSQEEMEEGMNSFYFGSGAAFELSFFDIIRDAGARERTGDDRVTNNTVFQGPADWMLCKKITDGSERVISTQKLRFIHCHRDEGTSHDWRVSGGKGKSHAIFQPHGHLEYKEGFATDEPDNI